MNKQIQKVKVNKDKFIRVIHEEGWSMEAAMNKILYDCYDAGGKPLGIIFARDCNELLKKNPKVVYVLGMDYFTRMPQWHKVLKNGLWPCGRPQR